jgi:3-carboxy-cis,cis-muconate cycloisomerase
MTLLQDELADPAIDAWLGDAALIAAMVEVEAALARVQGRLGLIPQAAAVAIGQAAAGFAPDLAGLRRGMAGAGVPVPALVAQLRGAAAAEAGAWLHWGATSQDILDTALILQLRAVLAHIEAQLAETIAALAALAARHRGTLTIARTRFQQALPTSFGLKVAAWLMPLVRHSARLAELRPRLLVVQLGGAAGTLAALGPQGLEVARGLAAELGLGLPPMPWHNQRDGLIELAGWLGLLAGSLGKLGQDVLLLCQNEVGELRDAAGGGSSTMPQKANPIRAEALLALARRSAGLVGAMHQAALHAWERDGSAWQLEWASLPPLASGAGAALGHTQALLRSLEVDADRMAQNLAASQGLLLAEAACLALARHLPRAEAQALVERACRQALAEGRDLFELLPGLTAAPVDWPALRDPRAYLGAADALLDQALAAAGAAPA